MDTELLKTVGQIAGIGGVALGVFLLLFRELIRKAILPRLPAREAARFLTLIAVLVWSVALAGIGAWVWTETREPSASSKAADIDVRQGAVGAGGNINGSQIRIGIPTEQLPGIIEAATKPLHKLTAEQQAVIVELEGRLNVNQTQLLTFFQIIGEENIAPERIGSKLVEIAQHYRDVLEQPAVTAQVRLALEAPDLERADALLAEMQEIQDTAVDRMALEAAATAAQRAGIALTRLRYGDAAHLFSKAAAQVPPDHDDLRMEYLEGQANALYLQGDEKGDNAALVQAIQVYQDLLDKRPRERMPLDWARIQNNRGIALSSLGERESGTRRLEEAVSAFRAALEEIARERAPLKWAGAKNNLGVALQRLGKRESGTRRLEEAVGAFRTALEEWTRERVPLDWAGAKNNLGAALLSLGKRESGTRRLEEAVSVFRAALQVFTRERMPLDWAMTKNNLCTVLSSLGERESGTRRLEEAVAVCGEALQVFTRERMPLDWAMTKNNLGVALQRLGKRESGTRRLEEAVGAFRAALEEWTRERVPLDWAGAKNNLGAALLSLGKRESGTRRLEEAVSVFRVALEERTRERVLIDWAETQMNLGKTHRVLGERLGDLERLDLAWEEIDSAWRAYHEAGYTYHDDEVQGLLDQVEAARVGLGGGSE